MVIRLFSRKWALFLTGSTLRVLTPITGMATVNTVMVMAIILLPNGNSPCPVSSKH
jgi:hypothetical protein